MASRTDTAEDGRRIRAALVLAGRSAEDVAPELNISARTLERVISGQRQPRDWELRRLAEVLKIPEWFLRDGLSGQPSADEVASEQIRKAVRDELRQLKDDLRDRDRQLQTALAQLRDQRARSIT